MIQIKRVYDPPDPEDGKRILVDRLWPRGIRKENLKMDEWLKEIAPSDKLSYITNETSLRVWRLNSDDNHTCRDPSLTVCFLVFK